MTEKLEKSENLPKKKVLAILLVYLARVFKVIYRLLDHTN